ncbi:ClpXP protease specificity-enhancing factor [uncultured Halomonas sp.]|uniref:ClpXP protease specificity-enhancing factor n=1 Tax=uncultured Halomonas sp. TaxID=173971 RepID=UPI00261E4631|nr:ClpXP protease specificity-enhancing factor [uncultured Halomonas sp.]
MSSSRPYSSRPYLARALYQWLLDNDLTPYIVVDAEQPGVEVPRQFVQNGQIVLNLSPGAVRDLFIESEALGFSARFGGVPMQVMVPTSALVAIYARENGVGMVFGHEPVLAPAETSEQAPGLASVDSEVDAGEEGDAPQAEAPPRKGKPSLRVIK